MGRPQEPGRNRQNRRVWREVHANSAAASMSHGDAVESRRVHHQHWRREGRGRAGEHQSRGDSAPAREQERFNGFVLARQMNAGVLRHSNRDGILVMLAIAQGALLATAASAPLIALGIWWNAN